MRKEKTSRFFHLYEKMGNPRERQRKIESSCESLVSMKYPSISRSNWGAIRKADVRNRRRNSELASTKRVYARREKELREE